MAPAPLSFKTRGGGGGGGDLNKKQTNANQRQCTPSGIYASLFSVPNLGQPQGTHIVSEKEKRTSCLTTVSRTREGEGGCRIQGPGPAARPPLATGLGGLPMRETRSWRRPGNTVRRGRISDTEGPCALFVGWVRGGGGGGYEGGAPAWVGKLGSQMRAGHGPFRVK